MESPLLKPLSMEERLRLGTLDTEARVEYLFEVLTQRETLWALEGGGKLLKMKLEDGRMALPLWPHQELAAEESDGEEPRALDAATLHDFILPQLGSKAELVAVFPMAGEALVMEAAEMLERMQKEWDEDD